MLDLSTGKWWDNMSDLNGNVTSSIVGGYSLRTRLDEASNKLSNVERRINELEAMIESCILSPAEIISFDAVDKNQDYENSQSTILQRENIYPTSVHFVISIPSKLIAELNSNLDMEYSLRGCKRELSDKVEEKKKDKGINVNI